MASTLSEIYDLTNPALPFKVSNLPEGSDGEVAVSGNYSYLVTSNSLVIDDISNPTQPQFVTRYQLSDVSNGLTIVGNKAYIAGGWDGLHILDLSLPTSPWLASSFKPHERDEHHYTDVAVSGNYAYLVEDRVGFCVIDISQPTNPSLVDCVDGYAVGIEVQDNLLLVTRGKYGFSLMDISNPATPVTLVNVDTQGEALHAVLVDSVIYIADGNAGVTTLRLMDPASLTHRTYLPLVQK